MRISDWSSDVCSSDLDVPARPKPRRSDAHQGRSCQQIHQQDDSRDHRQPPGVIMASVNKVILEDLYLHQKLSTTDIAKAIGVSASRARTLLIINEIPLRSRADGLREIGRAHV